MSDLQATEVSGNRGPMHEAFDNPAAYIPGDRRHSLATGIPMPDRVHGSALFADISGFTPLTEALANELGPQRGAEELTAHLNRVFHALIAELDRFGGHVIYFAGDAITCWLDGDDGARATACALAMQHTMTQLRELVTPAGTSVRLAMKIAIAVGAARRFLVGDAAVQRIDVLAGRLIDSLANAEHYAQRGEVVLDASALEALGDRVAVRELRVDPSNGRQLGVVERMNVPVPDKPVPSAEHELSEEVVREWLLSSVYERLRSERREFFAELRPAFPVFVRFRGIDYDYDDDAVDKLDDFIRHVQRILAIYGGNLLHLSLGDKGAYLFAVFGSPHAHEDDGARAAAAALELRELENQTAASDLQIGIAFGQLRSGTYGHANRQTFTCLGDAVNVAARLMSSAPPGHIYVSTRVRTVAGDVFDWTQLDPIPVKGRAEPVHAFALTGSKRHALRRSATVETALIGRTAELDRMTATLDEAMGWRGSVVGIAAEAGMGKSRLVAEFASRARTRDVVVALGECQSFGTHTSYFVWREVWSTLFGLDDAEPVEDQVKTVEAVLAAIDPALAARAPLLESVLDLPIPDNELTSQFDAKLRKTSLEALLVECLRARAAQSTLVLALEDCHWIDPLSRDLLEVIARAVAALPVVLVVAYRPSGKAGGGLPVDALPHFTEITLAELDAASAAALVASKLRQLIGADAEAPAALTELITKRAQGNPFYIEELLNFIKSQGVDPQNEAALRKLQLPESLHSLILSRIDALAEAPRQTLKVASVLGRVFAAPLLPGVYPELGGMQRVTDDLTTLGSVDLVLADPGGEDTYLFKHVVTQEVAYQSMPFGFRSSLHERVGRYLEFNEAESIERNLDLLAHHYWYSENLAKKCEYLGRAGDAAQANYANAAAIDYFERLAPLVEDRARVDVMLRLGRVLELVGNWQRAESVERESLAIAERLDDGRLRASCETALAEVARKQGRYDEAVAFIDRASRGFAALGEEAGVAKALHLAGTVAAQRGDYAEAEKNYTNSLEIRERAGDKASMASLLSNLGVIAEYRGDYDGSRGFHKRALELRTEIGDRWAIGVSMNNLGMIASLQKRFAEARGWFEKSMQINREIGDGWMVAIGHNNLGNATRGLEDYNSASEHYAASLRAYREYGDRWAMAFLLEDIGVLAALRGDARVAWKLVGAADAMRESIGTPRAPSLEAEIEKNLTAATPVLSATERDACRRSGRELSVDDAVDHALVACNGQ